MRRNAGRQDGTRAILFAVTMIVAAGCAASEPPNTAGADALRRACVAGRFYPAPREDLQRTVRALLDATPTPALTGRIVAALAPHAGYTFSAPVAAVTFKALGPLSADTVVIIGHDTHHPNAVAFLSPADYFETPLGKVPTDRAMMDAMTSFHRGIVYAAPVHSGEHTIEVQLPFLQVMNKSCRIVPILFGNPTLENCRILADAIHAARADKRVIVLASTDLSHYPPYKDAVAIDQATLKTVAALDPKALLDSLRKQETRGTIPKLKTAMCARGGVGTAMFFAQDEGADHARILKYANSGDVPAGNKSGVVGYGSVVFIKRPAVPPAPFARPDVKL